MVEFSTGSLFAGHRIEAVAGRGGMGVVYRATQLDQGRTPALKVIAPELAEDPRLRDRFVNESRVAASIDHPNVIPIFYAGEEQGVLFIAMRFVVGTDLRRLVRAEGRLALSRALHVFEQVADALDAAHVGGLFHRDVKPANVLLAAHDHAYLTDFGLTRRIASAIKFDGNGRDRIDFAFTPSHPSKYPTSIYYTRYRHGRFSRADGSRIARMRDLPRLPRQADTVYDAGRTHVPAWIHDVGVDRRGRAIVVYALIRGPHDHRYVYATWNGRRWVRRPIVAAGGTIVRTGTQPFYSGGISLDHSDPRVVYLSRPVGRHHEIERWTTRDQGATWTHRAITSRSTADNLRPVVPRGHTRRGVQLLWMHGVYRHYLHYRTRIAVAAARPNALSR